MKFPKQNKVIKITNKKDTKSKNNNFEDMQVIQNMQNQIDELETNSFGLKETNTSTTNQISSVSATVSQHTTDISGLSNRLTLAEQGISNNSSAITTANGNISANTNNISTLQTTVGTHTADISNLQTTVGSHTSSITSLQTQVGSNTSSISSHATRLTNAENTISGHTTQIGQNSNNIAINAQDISSLQTAVSNLQNATGVTTEFTDLANRVEDAEDDIEDIETALAGKQDTLTAGTGITIQNNVISSTGGGLASVTASDVDSESATSGQVLTANGTGGASWQTASGGSGSCNCASDIASLQSQVDNFYAVINDRNGIYNTSYQGIDPSLVYRTYDCIDRQYNYSGTGTFNSATFAFCIASDFTNLTLKITLKTKGQVDGGKGCLSLYFNSEYITATQNFIYDSNDELKEFIFDLNVSSAGNRLYFTVDSTNNTIFEISFAKLEVYNCKNPTFLARNKKYDVQFFNNYYYITNCTGKTAKYCIIHKDDLLTIQDIVWIDTGKEAQFMTFHGVLTSTNSGYVVNSVTKVYLMQDNTISFENNNGTTILQSNNFGYVCGMLPSSSYGEAVATFISTSNMFCYRYLLSSSNTITNNTISSNSSCSNIVGSKKNSDTFSNSTTYYYIMQNADGTSTFKYNNSKSYNFGYGVVMNCYVQDSLYRNFNVYSKVYDKIVKYNIKYVNSSTGVTLNSSEEIGYYDDYFEGGNNDYFVVKNNRLFYYKNSR